MGRLLNVAGAAGFVSLGAAMVGLSALLIAGPSVGAGFTSKTPEVAVNRSLKGDRLPVSNRGAVDAPVSNSAGRSGDLELSRSGQRPRIPVGCDAAFSPISAPKLAYIYRRCTT